MTKKTTKKKEKADSKKTRPSGDKLKKKPEEVKKISKKEQLEHENKILRNIFLGVGILIILVLVIMVIFNSINNFEYKGVKFEVVKEGSTLFYKTSLPVFHEGKEADYNFYLRNDPRKLDKLSFEGNLNLRKDVVLNSTANFNCEGDGVIGIANLLKLYDIIDAKVIKDESADCDPDGRYMFIRLQEGNETNIEEFSTSCYNLNINNCEVLEVTERLMIETFIKVNELL